jgi:hypothetical protein
MIRDKRAIVQQVLAGRLSLSGPPADKASLSLELVPTELTRQAIILSQTLHATYLGPLLAGLKTQLENPHPFLAAIAAQQHAAGQGYKDTQAESSTKASDQFKWDTWTETCGKSQAPWRPAPKQGDMGWGWWVAHDIGVEEWWTVPKAEEKDS